MENKFSTILIIIIVFTACTPVNKITSIEYIPINYQVVAKGNDSGVKNKLLIVAYNKYFNESQFDSESIRKNNLNTIDFGKNMLIELFLGNTSTKEEIAIDKIEENRSFIKVYYSTSNNKDSVSQESTTPFLIASMPKSRKPTKFFENGEEVKRKVENLYINN